MLELKIEIVVTGTKVLKQSMLGFWIKVFATNLILFFYRSIKMVSFLKDHLQSMCLAPLSIIFLIESISVLMTLSQCFV